MANKKTELYSSLCASYAEQRGGMAASQYKDYLLTLLFMKYVSDKYAKDPHGLIEVPGGADYNAMVALKNDKNIGEEINKIIGRLAEAHDLKGVIDLADMDKDPEALNQRHQKTQQIKQGMMQELLTGKDGLV